MNTTLDFVDLRSDTVSQPTSAMRKAMAQAEVGDDVYGEDPSINHLQDLAATMLKKEAALFVPSGTMGNLVAILTHCGRGDEVILGNLAHTFLFEAGGISALGGIHSCQVPNQPDGTIALEDLQNAIRGDDPHYPITRLITLENTHNRCGGVVLPLEYSREVGELARRNFLSLHLDGARLFNAAIALGISAAELSEPFDSVTFCLSKALCAPVGSILCGSADFIRRAHRIRKQLGGGMRQAGVLAAAGIVALETMVERLAEDHARAAALADGLRENSCLVLDEGTPYTNMIFLNLTEDAPVPSGEEAADRLKSLGVRVGLVSPRRFRLVTHYWIDDEAVEKTINAFQSIMTHR
jgi:threonine aldolase